MSSSFQQVDKRRTGKHGQTRQNERNPKRHGLRSPDANNSPTFKSQSPGAKIKRKRKPRTSKSPKLPESAVKAFVTRCQEVERVCRNNLEKSSEKIFKLIENKFPDFLPELRQFYRKEKEKVEIPTLIEVIRKTMAKEIDVMEREGSIMKDIRSERFAKVIDGERFPEETPKRRLEYRELVDRRIKETALDLGQSEEKRPPFKGRPDLVPLLKIPVSIESKEDVSVQKDTFSKNKFISEDNKRQERVEEQREHSGEGGRSETENVNEFKTPQSKIKKKKGSSSEKGDVKRVGNLYGEKRKTQKEVSRMGQAGDRRKESAMVPEADGQHRLETVQEAPTELENSQKDIGQKAFNGKHKDLISTPPKFQRKEPDSKTSNTSMANGRNHPSERESNQTASFKNQELKNLSEEVNILKKRNYDMFMKFSYLEKCYTQLKKETRYYYNRMKEVKDEVLLQRRFDSPILNLHPQIRGTSFLREYFFTLYRRLAFMARSLDMFRKNLVRVSPARLGVGHYNLLNLI